MLVRCLYYCGFFCSCLISPAGAGGFDEASHMDGVALFELRRRMWSRGCTQAVLPVEPREAGKLCLRVVFFTRFGLHRYALLLACRYRPHL